MSFCTFTQNRLYLQDSRHFWLICIFALFTKYWENQTAICWDVIHFDHALHCILKKETKSPHASGKKSESGNGPRICSKVKIFFSRFSDGILCISRDTSHIWDSFQQAYCIMCEKLNLQRFPNFKIFWEFDEILMRFW